MIQPTKVDIVTGGLVRAEYAVKHSTPGADGITTTGEMSMMVYSGRVEAKMVLDKCEAATPDEAFDKMEKWCLRMAEAIRERRKGMSLPL